MAGGGAVAAVVAAGDLDDDTFGQLPPSRRESSMMMAMEHEDNFFEKARRVVLRAMGVGGNKRRSAASSSHGSLLPISAEEIEAKQKIKVKMPKRPSKKGMEFNIALWNADHPSEHVIEEEDGETVAEEASPSAVVHGIERWVFGAKDDRQAKPARAKNGAKGTPTNSPMRPEVSPAESGGKTIHDYVRAM